MNTRSIALSLVISVGASAMAAPIRAEASVNFDVRRRVIGLAGIMNVTNIDEKVTRGEFAKMLVNASSYGSMVNQVSNTSVFADVPKDNEYASYIRIASDQGWMSGYLGGVFKPDNLITLQEAVKGVLALLGYTNEDFTGDQAGARISKYYYLELNEQIEKSASDTIIKEDCINLFYNLLKTDTKDGSFYGKVLDCELTSDGEINPLTLADNSLKGPKLVRNKSSLANYIPFDLDNANIFLNGHASNRQKLQQVFNIDDEYLLIYYHSKSQTIWAYSESGEDENQGRYVITGEITNIVYTSTDVVTPSAIILDDDDDLEFQLTDSEMQFAFSMYGDMRVGDEVTIVYSKTETNGDEVKTVLDYLEK